MNRDIYRQLKEERGVDIRPPATAILGVSSADRYATPADRFANPTSPFNFSLTSKQNFLNGFFTRLALTEIKFTWALPTITQKNYQINITYRTGGVAPGTLYTLSLTNIITGAANGWANPTTIAAELQTLIRSATGNVGFTLVADAVTGQFTAASNNTDTFQFSPVINSSYPNRTTIYQMMGWYGSGFFTSVISGVPTMLWTQFVDIVCPQLTYNQDLKDADTGTVTRDILARVYLTPQADQNNPELIGSQPFVIYRDFSTPKQIRWSHNQPVGNMTFEVYDDSGELLSARPTALFPQQDAVYPDWNFTLLVTEQ